MALSPVLSKERPDHPSLDYELLRSEGILHLENLATEVWTDFNAHDPGITLVELLSYAITDLGYRTRKLPIADIVAGGKEKSFFEPIEILPCAPVTARDFRKILIDIDGVKNAWVEPHRSPLLFTDKGIDYGLFEIDKLSLVKDIQEKLEAFLTRYNEDKVEKVTLIQAKKWIQGWKEGEISCTQNGIDPNTFFDPCSNPLTNVNIAQPPSKETDACSFLFALLCQYGYIPLGVLNLRLKGPLNPMVINGLLKVTLELDDAINPENESETRPILEQVSKRLQANRFLGHDYVKPFTLVGKLPIAICLHLEVASGKNALETAAAALWQIEQHLNPTLRFQTFQEMLDKGYRMDEIYNGPLLNHGFLDNHEVDAAQLLTQFRHSDLSNAATVSPDVLTVHELKVKVYPKSSFEVNTIYPIFDPQSTSDPAEEKDPTKLSRPLKPVIDLCKSCVYVTQDGVRCELQEEALAEALELKRLLTECHHPPGGPTIPTGAFRPDLAEYRSLQYDLPAVYGVGDYGVSSNISLAKQGVRKQLQAYLAFFDQLFAAYLLQLKDIRRLLAVEQMPHLPTYQNADLSAIPGLGEIIDAKKSFSIESRATQEDRSNRLLNHLLARFGEVFSEYTAAVATACKANSGADYYTNYQEFLAAKAAFLKEVHYLGFSRGMAFDYTGGSAKKVWNTSNVAGVKKRVHRLLGLKGSWIQQSLLTKPAYRLDVVEVMGNRNAKQYQIVFKVLNENLPEEVAYRGTLLRSPKYNSRKIAQDRRDFLNADIWKPDFYKIDKHPRGNGQQTVFFTLEGKDELWGDPLEETAVNDLQQFIQSLVSFEPSNDKEGFHVLEHILLRPNDIDDQVLKISTGATPLYTPRDPYSNWITVIVPNWLEKFKRKSFQQHFEQIFRSETPAEMMLRFCWFDKETMRDFEERFKAWLEAKANCTPNECHITETANELIDWLNKTPCSCNCQHCCEEEQTCLECRECNQ